MRRKLVLKVAGLWLAPLLGLAVAHGSDLTGSDPVTGKAPQPQPAPVKQVAKEEGGCGNHGTSVIFVDSPKEAAKQAKKEQKLVFVLHVSGLFEDPTLT